MSRTNAVRAIMACGAGACLFILPPSIVLGLAASAAVAVYRPAAGVALLALTSLVHPTSSLGSLAIGGSARLGLVGGLIWSMVLASRVRPRPTHVWLVAAPTLVLTTRLAIAGNTAQAELALACALFAAAGLIAGTSHRQQAMLALGIAAPAFAVASALWSSDTGVTSASLAGVSGNPNRMVFALATLAPFVLLRSGSRWLPAQMAFLVATVSLLSRSASAQALPAVAAVIGMVLLTRIRSRWQTALHPRTLLVIGTSTVVGVLVMRQLIGVLGSEFSSNQATLSGRTELFSSAWSQFWSSPIIGTGALRVGDEFAVETSSAHNAYLALLSCAGVLVALPLLAVLVAASRRLPQAMAQGDPAPSALVAMALLASVQGLELQVWSWFIVGLTLSHPRARRPHAVRPLNRPLRLLR